MLRKTLFFAGFCALLGCGAPNQRQQEIRHVGNWTPNLFPSTFASTSPSTPISEAPLAPASELGWFCWKNRRVYNDSGCGRSLQECRKIMGVRKNAYVKNDIGFEPEECRKAESAPYCLALDTKSSSYRGVRCFQDFDRCALASQHVTADQMLASGCVAAQSTYLEYFRDGDHTPFVD